MVVSVEGVALFLVGDQGPRPVPGVLLDSQERPAVQTENLLQVLDCDPARQISNLEVKKLFLILASFW